MRAQLQRQYNEELPDKGNVWYEKKTGYSLVFFVSVLSFRVFKFASVVLYMHHTENPTKMAAASYVMHFVF